MNYYRFGKGELSLIGDYDDREDAQVDANCTDPDWLFISTEDQLTEALPILDDILDSVKKDEASERYFTVTGDGDIAFAGEFRSKGKAVKAIRPNNEWMNIVSERNAYLTRAAIVRLELTSSLTPK